MSRMPGIACVVLLGAVTTAHARPRGVVRLGVMSLDLESSEETPLFGDDVGEVVTAYNLAAAAYDRQFGGMTSTVDAGDLGVRDTLVTFAPGLETSGDLFF